MPQIDSDGVVIEYADIGNSDGGVPVLMIAGLGYSSWFWECWVGALLAERYRVVTPSNRGAGKSGKPPGPYSTTQMAADALAVIDALNLERVFLVGHSLGGFIAQTFTLAYPERVAKLVLCGTSFGGPNSIPPTPEALAVLMLDRTLDPMELIRRGLATAVAPSFLTERPEDLQALIEHRLTIPVPPESFQSQLMAGLGHNAEATVSKITQPTLILSGELDMVVPPGNAALLKEKIPHAVCQTIPDAGHLFPIEKPSLTAKLIDEFFSL